MENSKVAPSVTGKLTHAPVNPKIPAKTMTKGIKKMYPRNNASAKACFARPMAEKKILKTTLKEEPNNDKKNIGIPAAAS